MPKAPLVTAVIPTWNRAKLVEQAINSVLAQTHRDWELFIVDDGSTDATLEGLKAFDDPRLTVLALDHTGNTGRLRDIGAAAGTGEWLAFLDSDDLWEPDKLEIQLAAVAQSKSDWCYSTYRLIDRHGAPIALRAGELRAIAGWIIDDLLGDRTGVHADTLLVRRPLFEAVGGFGQNELRYREDLDLAFRLALAAEAAAAPQPLARVRDHGARKTSDLELAHEHTARVYELILPRLSSARSILLARRKLAHHLSEAGAVRLARREFARGIGLLFRAALLGERITHGMRALGRGIRGALSARSGA